MSTSNLPGHDHAMLFTRYGMTSGGSIYTAGLTYIGTACKSYAQSFVKDDLNFIILTVASHELGHSLRANHDRNGNTCNDSYAYIMASSDPVTGSVATNPWKFSTCSTAYFTTYLNSLDSTESKCMRSLSTTYNVSALVEFANVKPGQVYDANAQCANMEGSGSYLCTSFYSGGDLSTICTLMWCYMPSKPGYCSRAAAAADGITSGTNNWCIAGVCTPLLQRLLLVLYQLQQLHQPLQRNQRLQQLHLQSTTKPTTTTSHPTTTTKPTTTTTTPNTTTKPTTTITTPTTTTKPTTTTTTPTTTKPTTTTSHPTTTIKSTNTTKKRRFG